MTPGSRSFRLFSPILAGATLKDRVIASGGALVCVAVTALLCAQSPLALDGFPAIVAPVGASAVLLFAVPSSPLAQPWPIIGGNVVSAIVGVTIAQTLGHSAWAMGIAVAVAIMAMSLLRCLHPPGGAVAMTAVVGGPAVWGAGFLFPFSAVAVDTMVLVATGWLFHRISGHSYPHRAKTPGAAVPKHNDLHRADINQALADVGEAFDVSSDDLEILLERAEHYARLRNGRPAPKPG